MSFFAPSCISGYCRCVTVSSVVGQHAAREIIEATRNTQTDVVEVWELDLGSFASTKSFADRVERELQRLDILVENAGLATNKWSTTSDGYETT